MNRNYVGFLLALSITVIPLSLPAQKISTSGYTIQKKISFVSVGVYAKINKP